MPVIVSNIVSLDGFYEALPKHVVSDTYSVPTDNPWHGLLAQGLVDELRLMVSPGAVGSGTPLFAGPCELALRSSRRFDGSDNVLLRYAVRS